jgi:hypothetical protein
MSRAGAPASFANSALACCLIDRAVYAYFNYELGRTALT